MRSFLSLFTFLSGIVCVLAGCLALAASPVYGQVSIGDSEEKDVIAQQLMVQAMTQSFLGYHDKAIPILEQALQVSPSSATINSAIAESHEHLGDLSSAIFYANQALLLDASEIYFHRHLIRLHIQSDDFESAEALLEDLLVTFPNDITSIEDLVEIKMLLGKNTEALENQNKLIALVGNERSNLEIKLHLLKVLQQWPDYEATLVELNEVAPQWVVYKQELALFYINRGRSSEAINILTEAIELAPDDPTITSMLANQYRKAGNDSLAQVIQGNQQRVAETDPDAAYRSALRIVSSENNNSEEINQAISILQRALDRTPNHVEANGLLGTLLYEQRQFAEAAPILRKAIDLNPKSQDLWAMAIEALYKSNEYKEASFLSEDALLLFPGQLPLLELSAQVNFRLQQYDTALDRIVDYLAYTEDNSLRAEGLALSGLIYVLQNQTAKADSTLTLARSLTPDNSRVLALTALSLAEQNKDLDRALGYANKAISQEGDIPEYVEIAGRIQFKMGNLTESENILQQVIDSGYASPRTHEYLGDVYFESGNPNKAVASWTKSLELNPSNVTLREKLQTHSN